jgi:starch synthase
MTKKRLLIIAQELDPYTEDTFIANLIAKLPQFAQDKGGFELRVLMPKYGTINERRHRLHEVVRLSGMNIIIDDDDYPLVIKVASMPNSRMQVYFLENEDYFKRKFMHLDEDGNGFEDNHERMIFFSKAVLETVKKFGWAPDIIHCHGWLTSLVPVFVKEAYNHEPIFNHSTVIYSVYDENVLGALPENFAQKASINGMSQALLAPFIDGDQLNEKKGAFHYADAVIKGSETYSETVTELIDSLEKPVLESQDKDTYLPAYIEFYKKLMGSDEEA